MALKPPEERRGAVDQMLANWRIEGFVPDEGYLALLDEYVAGTMTLKEVGAQIDRRRGMTQPTSP